MVTNNLRIKSKLKDNDIFSLKNFTIKDVTIKPMDKNIYISDITANKVFINMLRDKRGKIDWLKYLKIDTKSKPKKKQKKGLSLPWKIFVKKIALERAVVDFRDKKIKPNVRTKINNLDLYIKNFTLAGNKPLDYKLNMLINNNMRCSSNGDIIQNVLNIESYIKCNGFNIVHYRAYIDAIAKQKLKKYNVRLQRASINFDTNISVKDSNKTIRVLLKNANFDLNKVLVNKKYPSKRLLSFNRFSIKDLYLDTKTKNISINTSYLRNFYLRGERLRNGAINLENLIVLKHSKSIKKKKITQKKVLPSYKIYIKHFGIKASKITFIDKTLRPYTKNKIDRIFFNAYNINSKKYSWLRYRLYMKVNSKGIIKSNGKIRHTPLKQNGTLDIKNLSLKDLNPYIKKKVFLKIDSGYLNLKSKINYSKNKKRADFRANGLLDVEDFFLKDSRNSMSLLSFNTIGLNPFTLELFPNRFYIDELNLNSFYVNALINKKKVLNLISLVKDNKLKQKVVNKNKTAQNSKFPIRIMKVNVKDGSAKFADLSIPIPFKSDIHDLNGAIYSISNIADEMSYIDIDGEVNKYGSTKLKGVVDSLNPKRFTDLSFNFKNLALKNVSGYSLTFAGYEIDSGKLSLNLGYKIKNSKLLGKNNIVIKHIKVGNKSKDKNATHLPLGFVISLLEDSNGIIDIDMPVKGDVNKPDFKYGTLIWKAFSNLIFKVVSSPFRFLGSLIGIKGDSLQGVDFEYGKSNILPAQREKLDNIAKIMFKRPKISIAISGSYDKVKDKIALQKQKLISLIIKKSDVKNRDEHISMMNIAILENIYKNAKGNKELNKLKANLHKKYTDKEYENKYINILLNKDIKVQNISNKKLISLAKNRLKVITDYLNKEKNIALFRIKLLGVTTVSNSPNKMVRQSIQVKVK